jgi:hypothetical protein
MNSLPALLLAAAGVGVGHAVMPDHWLPLAIMSRTRRYRAVRVARLSLAAALAHVVASLVLGGVLIVIGLRFRATVASHSDLVVGSILLATGAVLLILDLRGKGHGHSHSHHKDGRDGHDHVGDDREHRHDHGDRSHRHHGNSDHDHDGLARPHGDGTTAVLARPGPAAREHAPSGVAGLLVPFGAAASPDLTILPIFLAASALGTTAALGCLAAFTVATAATIVGLTTATALGARLLTAPWIDRRANFITAITLIAMGGLAAAGLI